MPDAIFEDPRLAAVYDPLDPDRSDLDVYVAIAAELDARFVLDVGCGTGTFALLLADRDLEVAAVHPALASLDVARAKPGAERVRWLHGDATSLPPLQVDLATMTANVAQAIVRAAEWHGTLAGHPQRPAFQRPARLRDARPGEARASDRPGREFVFFATRAD